MPDNNFNPLVTVITVTYNSSAFVRDAIESVLAQTYTHIQYIIGDDCSTDNTWEIIQEYSDPRIEAYINEKNIGEYSNRNKAINFAKGEFIIFIDGDDYIYSHALPILLKYMQDFSNAVFAIMCPENPFLIYPIQLSPREAYEIEFSEFSILNRALSHTFYRSYILKKYQFHDNGYYSRDTLNRMEILQEFSCILVNDNLTWWRHSEGQASKALSLTFKNELFLMAPLLFNSPNCPLNTNNKIKYLRNSKIKLIRQLIKMILKFKFRNAVQLFNNNRLRISDLRYLFTKINFDNPLKRLTTKGIL